MREWDSDKGEGVKNPNFFVDVICERPTNKRHCVQTSEGKRHERTDAEDGRARRDAGNSERPLSCLGRRKEKGGKDRCGEVSEAFREEFPGPLWRTLRIFYPAPVGHGSGIAKKNSVRHIS